MKPLTLVFKSSRDPSKHHRARVVATDPLSVLCTCPAGRRGGKCKHIRLLSLLKDWGTGDEIHGRWGNQPGW